VRAAAWVGALVLLAGGLFQAQEPERSCDSHSAVRCAAIDKDAYGFRACKCSAREGAASHCDQDGKRTSETMKGCVNPDYCMKKCCHCCPKD
jgi:hypothetical protein